MNAREPRVEGGFTVSFCAVGTLSSGRTEINSLEKSNVLTSPRPVGTLRATAFLGGTHPSDREFERKIRVAQLRGKGLVSIWLDEIDPKPTTNPRSAL